MSATDYAQYLEQEWEHFVAHPDRAAVATQIETHIGRAERVLDVGCGAGQELLPYLDRAICVGLDLSEEGPPLARDRLSAVNARARMGVGRARAESLPIRSDHFDLVICRLVLPHTHVASALAEAARVLRPGGGYSVQIHSPLYYLRMFRRAVAEGDFRWRKHAWRVLRTGLTFHLTGRQREIEVISESFLTQARLRRMAAAVQLDLVTQLENGNPHAPHFLFRRRDGRRGRG